jgi:hypothetical protein
VYGENVEETISVKSRGEGSAEGGKIKSKRRPVFTN